MVGVPGRSRACQTCKKRRIACDLREPACGQCVKTNRTCPGYSRGFIFVANQKGTHKTKYEKELNLGANTSTASSASSPSANSSGSRSSPTASSQNEIVPFDAVVLHQGQFDLSSTQSISPKALIQEQLFANALSGWQSPNVDSQFRSPPWMPVWSMLGHSSPATKAPALACYMAWMGRRIGDKVMLEGSMQLYLQGLNEVQRALSSSSTALGDQVLAGLLSLIMYEAVECPELTRTAYGWHVDGCIRLVKLRGVNRHRDGLGHDLFLAFRTHGVLRALELRQSTFLATASWSTIPWQIHPKSIYDRLLDLLVIGPEIFEKADRMNEGPAGEVLFNILALLEQCYMLHLKLNTVYDDMALIHPAPLFWSEPASASSTIDPSALTRSHDLHFDTTLNFPSLEVARDMTFYWTISALLSSGVADLYSALESAGCGALLENGSAPGGLQFLLVRSQWPDLVRNILRSFDYFMSPAQGETGPFRISAPINVAVGILQARKGYERELNWALGARKRLAEWLALLRGLS